MPEYLDEYAKFYEGLHDFESKLDEFLEYDYWSKNIELSNSSQTSQQCEYLLGL